MRRSQTGGKVERLEQTREQTGVAEAHVEFGAAGLACRLERQSEDIGVGRLAIGTAEAFEPGLNEFTRKIAAKAKDRPEIRELRRRARMRRGEIGAAYGDRIFRAQTEFIARRIARQENPAANILAFEIEKDRGGLQDRRLAAAIARRNEMGEQGITPFREHVCLTLQAIRAILHTVMPGQSRSKNGVASLAYRAGIHAVMSAPRRVDGRDKPGHDEVSIQATAF